MDYTNKPSKLETMYLNEFEIIFQKFNFFTKNRGAWLAFETALKFHSVQL